MGEVRGFVPEKLVMPMLCAPDQRVDQIHRTLEERFGRIDYQSGPLSFEFTSYYEPEMGPDLVKSIVSFETLVDPQELSAIKLFTNQLELEYSTHSGERSVNLDPGLIGLRRFILATSKDNGHRIPLRDGIYAEVTMLFMDGDFTPLFWTYPDYQTDEYRAVLRQIRELYKKQLREHPS